MTSLFKRSSSPYYYMKVKNPSGKWRMKSTGTRDKKLAEKIMHREEWRVWDEQDNRTLREIVDEFLAYQEKRISVSYWEMLKARLNDLVNWLKNIGITSLEEIQYYHIENFINYRLKEDEKNKRPADGPKTVNAKLTMIKQILQYAVDREYIIRNPATRIKPIKYNKPQIRYFSDEELTKIFDNCGVYVPIFTILLHTGLRLNDGCTLKWEEVDLKNRRLTKLTEKEKIIVRQHINKTEMKIFNAQKNDTIYVFPNMIERKNQYTARAHLKRILGKHEITGHRIGLHTFRHTCASKLISGGASLYEVSQHLGHSSIDSTQIYAHLQDEKLRSISEIID